ncbi:TPA: glutathione S-transferase domain-containing protein [Legionella feeleii]
MAPCYYQTLLAAPLYRNRRPDEHAAYLEEQLRGKRYLVDEQFTIADIAITIFFSACISQAIPWNMPNAPI